MPGKLRRQNPHCGSDWLGCLVGKIQDEYLFWLIGQQRALVGRQWLGGVVLQIGREMLRGTHPQDGDRDALDAERELERRLEDINASLDVPITVNINGCPNSCARIQVADIGFKGQMVDAPHLTRARKLVERAGG